MSAIKLCPRCRCRLDPAITDPAPTGCGQDVHPLCDTSSWWTDELLATAERLIRQPRSAA